MQFKVGRTNLYNALGIAGRSLGNSIEIATTCYRFQVSDQLIISACNFETSIITKIPVEGDSIEIDVMIPADLLRKLLAGIPDCPLTFDFTKNDDGKEISYDLVISYADSTCKMTGYDGQHFPRIKVTNPKTLSMDYTAIHSGLFLTENAMASKDEENKLSAVHFEMSESGLSFTAFNGAYLATYNVPGSFEKDSILLPTGIVSIISSLPLRGECTISYTDKNVSVEIGNTTISSVLKAGLFIDWRPNVVLWPDYVTFDREAFISAAKQALIFANKINQQLSITITGTKITIKGQDRDFNYMLEQTIPCSEYKEEITMGLDGNFLLKCLSKMDGKEVIMYFTSPTKFIVYKSEVDGSAMSLLAPQALNL